MEVHPHFGLSDIPSNGSGHSLVAYESQLVLFGGIHDITWKLDDLLAFNINKNGNQLIKILLKERKLKFLLLLNLFNVSRLTPIIRPISLRKLHVKHLKKQDPKLNLNKYYFPKNQNIVMNEANKNKILPLFLQQIMFKKERITKPQEKVCDDKTVRC
ncbi:unnamed protein product (macronuclear) [Paramecium tetraurelia]|uniref:Uncharacterized protein n=1 Tax=Paramecium tetraurelia TaxID=5888 RepID=A0BUB9_PARTE|nr:uncharacterized protein GSPATT00032368001 [Paramecium tetraurelia]CAK62136.1 unnamed protein product [Paramecium tetraurelia]|eukprot:XP_001429534.1 hypothetical protein (macronuclear) [Paramecium tetraurelia strain d4-2]